MLKRATRALRVGLRSVLGGQAGIHRGLLAAIVLAAPPGADAARKERLELGLTRLELPGAPAALVPADVDGDGVLDLAVVIAYTEWDQIEVEEATEMDETLGLVEVLTIVPSLTDRRELVVFLGRREGGYEASGPPLALDTSVLSLEAGPFGHPVIALTDRGIAALRLEATGEPRLEPLIDERPILAGTGNFVSGLRLVHDLDGDGRLDLLFPTDDGASVFLGTPQGLDRRGRLLYPFDEPVSGRVPVLHYPLPEVRDVDGDGLPDLVMPHHETRWRNFQVAVNRGGGRFEPVRAPLGAYDPDAEGDGDVDGRLVYFGDLDGDGRAEYVIEEDLAAADAGWRKELKDAKRPPFRYRLYAMDESFAMAAEPYAEFETLGYAFDSGGDDDSFQVPGGLQDLDGDGRLDLVCLTLDFTLFQAIRVLTVRAINVGLDFHLWCQDESGGFRAVSGLDLSGKFRLNLNNLKLGQLSQFAGDFDGDGRADFVQMGRGRKVSIHRGRDGCFYAPEPDLLLELDEEPRDLGLVRVEDYDGDELSDLLVIQPQKAREEGVTPPVRLDLYVSGEPREEAQRSSSAAEVRRE